MNDDEKYGIGSAIQFFGGNSDMGFQGEANPGFTGHTISDDPGYTDWLNYDYQGAPNPGFTKHTISDDPGYSTLGKLLNTLKGLGGKAVNFAQTPQGIMALLGAVLGGIDRPRESGGGVGTAYAGYKPLTRTMQGNIARYAADGGIMHAYAQGGAVRPFPMQDGGFVMTKRAVDGAGGPEGMRQRIPEAVPIRGPGHGTSDSIPAFIQGPNGRTPAKVSNGEMYVPPGRDTRGLYALMRAMERKA